MLWAILAILFSFCYASFAVLNHYFKLDGARLQLWRSVVWFLWLAPVMFFVKWPSNYLFYVIIVGISLAMAVSSIVRFNLAAKRNGRVASMFQPVQAFAAFFGWMLVRPEQWQGYIDEPWRLTVVILCLFVMSYALFSMRKNDVGWQGFLIIAPIGILHAVCDVFTKIAMSMDTHIFDMSMVFGFILAVVGAIGAVIPILISKKERAKVWLPPKMLLGSFVIGTVGALGAFFAILSIALAPNPAYFVAISMLAPVWILFYHKLYHISDDASPVAGTIMVFSAIALVLVAAL